MNALHYMRIIMWRRVRASTHEFHERVVVASTLALCAKVDQLLACMRPAPTLHPGHRDTSATVWCRRGSDCVTVRTEMIGMQ